MHNLEYIKASFFNGDGELEYKIHGFISSSTYKSDDFKAMKIQFFPLYKERIINEDRYLDGFSCYKPSIYDEFDIKINHFKQSASFFSEDIILPEEARNCGIGTYLISRLITWGMENKASNYRVNSLRLGLGDAFDDNRRDLRNSFYEKIGFKLKFPNDSEYRSGNASASTLAQLKPNYNEKKIEVLDPLKIIRSREMDYIYLQRDCKRQLSTIHEYIDDLSNMRKKLRQQKIITFTALLIAACIYYV